MIEDLPSLKPSRPLPSTSAWIIIHVFIPLMPFLLGALVRFLAYPSLSWNTFNAAELALSLGFISAFVRQSLLDTEKIFDDPDVQVEIASAAAISLFPVLLFFTLFGAIEVFNTLVNDRQLKDMEGSLRLSQGLVYLFFIPSLILIIRIQRSFKLKARLS